MKTTVKQCPSCPWRVDCDPDQDIPGGYSRDLHKGLKSTIASSPFESMLSRTMHVMACHYSEPGKETPCAGWLANQLGPGNNIGLRLAVMSGKMPTPEIDSEQHETFEDTIPTCRRKRR